MTQPPTFSPNITGLKKRAKELKRLVDERNPEALARLTAAGVPFAEPLALRSAQLVLARELGFEGWHDLIEEAGERLVDERDLHRWFAVSLNNAAWAVIDEHADTDSLPPHVRDEAVYRVYASTYHWMKAGTPIHQGRGEHLISRTLVLFGRAESALTHADRYLEIIAGHPDLAEDWDIAFAYEARRGRLPPWAASTRRLPISIGRAACARRWPIQKIERS